MGEIASAKNLDAGELVNQMLHFAESGETLYDCFINPKYKVGTEWVNKTQNLVAVTVGISSIIKNVFGRLFRYLVDMCNSTLIDPTMKKVNFIGVLDIAGFEIFEFNTFEQLCINFVNEKVRKFFKEIQLIDVFFTVATVFQPPYVCVGTRRIHEGGHHLGFCGLWNGFGCLY